MLFFQRINKELLFLYFSLLNQNDPKENVAIQALLNPGGFPR